jgi:hypothetical protein
MGQRKWKPWGTIYRAVPDRASGGERDLLDDVGCADFSHLIDACRFGRMGLIKLHTPVLSGPRGQMDLEAIVEIEVAAETASHSSAHSHHSAKSAKGQPPSFRLNGSSPLRLRMLPLSRDVGQAWGYAFLERLNGTLDLSVLTLTCSAISMKRRASG